MPPAAECAAHLADRLRPNAGAECVGTELILFFVVELFGEKFPRLERREAGLDHNVILEIEDALEVA